MCKHHNPWARLPKRPTPDNFDLGSELRAAIKKVHECDARWVESVPVTVTEADDGEVVWDGTVHVFALRGHPKATRCFAWPHVARDGERWCYAVLELGDVTNAATAVLSTITSTHGGAS